MKDNLFVIAIGGTGMRCLEAFVHLCAVGMFDNEEINILTLDTDQSNGNKGRVERLIELYNKVKTDNPDSPGGSPNSNTFFSSKLNLYRFYTDYSMANRSTYSKLSATQGVGQGTEEDDHDLADLFLEHDTVQSFNLEHGYRAQTHLGSMLMYHGIVEAACHYVANKAKATEPELQLADFLTELQKSGTGARVFVFGSVFGGTGASSIPVVPEALKEAGNIISQNTIDFNKVKFGATLLTEYFSFQSPSDAQRKQEKLIASSDYFAINSQAALQFYQNDKTVKERYKRLYHVGWPAKDLNVSDSNGGNTITGGAEQKNACHVVELMSACAAYDFFTIDEQNLQNTSAQYLYRSVELDDAKNLTFRGTDFVSQSKASEFMQKLGSFLTLAHIVLSKHGGALLQNNVEDKTRGTRGFIARLAEQEIPDYNDMKKEQSKEIDDYMKEFAYSTENGTIKRGWIYQVYNSVRLAGVSRFLFPSKVFEENVMSLAAMDPCKEIQEEKKSGLFKTDKRTDYDDFIKNLPKCRPVDEKQNVSTMKERFLAHMFNAINITIPFSAKL